MVTTWLMIVGTASVATALGTGTDSNSSFSVYFVIMNFCLLSKPGKARRLGFSKNPEHIRANFDLFDFELTREEMVEIAALNKDKRYYTSTPEMLKRYAEMVPPVDEQK